MFGLSWFLWTSLHMKGLQYNYTPNANMNIIHFLILKFEFISKVILCYEIRNSIWFCKQLKNTCTLHFTFAQRPSIINLISDMFKMRLIEWETELMQMSKTVLKMADWKENLRLQSDLDQYLKWAEILQFMERDYSEYSWSLPTLDRHLRHLIYGTLTMEPRWKK